MKSLVIERLSKNFVLHLRDKKRLQVLSDISLDASLGECIGLTGPSGSGKSTLLRTIYGNYRADSGSISILQGGIYVDIVGAGPQEIMQLRTYTIGYVSQFLNVIPRVPTRTIVANILMRQRVPKSESYDRAENMLLQLNLPPKMHGLPPRTFSGGEQQRVNIACVLVGNYDLLLLDEPTASLDSENASNVISLIQKEKKRGKTIICIFHDKEQSRKVVDKFIQMDISGGNKL